MSDSFHLCQPEPILDSIPSCAACCGIYNYFGHSRETVTAILEKQTRLMEEWDGSEAGIERIREEVESTRPPARFEVIYNCPFAGFLDAGRTRVGCLLHPRFLGEDLRDFCRYGHRTCGEARCTAYTYLDPGEAEAVMASAGDWYLYGLAITDIDLVKDFFELVEIALHRSINPGLTAQEPLLAAAFHRYLALKENWPFATDPGRFGKYYFVGREYRVYLIDYPALGASRPFHDGILLSLGSVINTREELEQAISMIDRAVEEFASLYEELEKTKVMQGSGG